MQLESVKKLINLEDDQVTNDRNFPPPVCRHPALPLDLQPVCTSQEAVSIFSSLSKQLLSPLREDSLALVTSPHTQLLHTP